MPVRAAKEFSDRMSVLVKVKQVFPRPSKACPEGVEEMRLGTALTREAHGVVQILRDEQGRVLLAAGGVLEKARDGRY